MCLCLRCCKGGLKTHCCRIWAAHACAMVMGFHRLRIPFFSTCSRGVGLLQVGRPRVCFACAAALAMVTEGQPDACDVIEQEGGIQALVQLLTKGGGQGKKVRSSLAKDISCVQVLFFELVGAPNR